MAKFTTLVELESGRRKNGVINMQQWMPGETGLVVMEGTETVVENNGLDPLVGSILDNNIVALTVDVSNPVPN